MFVNSVQSINSRLETLHLSVSNMQPKTEKPTPCHTPSLPTLHLTPSGTHQRKCENLQSTTSPWLLRPNHEIPSTPPPQTDPKPLDFFPKRFG